MYASFEIQVIQNEHSNFYHRNSFSSVWKLRVYCQTVVALCFSLSVFWLHNSLLHQWMIDFMMFFHYIQKSLLYIWDMSHSTFQFISSCKFSQIL